MADSLTLRLPGTPDPVRVYELRVRPKDLSMPALVGSVFVDRRAGDIVRMDFTFTAAAYVDQYLDYINISLDNGLWRGRFWLPNQQRVELRRRIPQLDIPAGSVIRANMRIGNYEFNQALSPLAFAGPPVAAVPRAEREAFDFEQGLFEELREEGLGPQAELSDIRRLAGELAREQALRRVSGLRLRIPAASEVIRYNRAEGLALGLGLATTPLPGLRLGAYGGFAFGAEHPRASLSAEGAAGATRIEAAAYLNRPRDVGVGPVVSGAINSLSSLFAAEDFTDLYFADGVEAAASRALSGRWTLRASARAESQAAAPNAADYSVFGGDFRDAPRVRDTDLFLGGRVGVARTAPSGAASWWTLDAGVELGRGEYSAAESGGAAGDDALAFAQPTLDAAWGLSWSPREAALRLELGVGWSFGEIPAQELFLIGGRGTVPGYPFRGFGGDRFATARATASAALREPWLRGRAFGALGWTGAGGAGEDALFLQGAEVSGGVEPSIGVGVGVFHDILRLDLARGLGARGRWELIVEALPSFWDVL